MWRFNIKNNQVQQSVSWQSLILAVLGCICFSSEKLCWQGRSMVCWVASAPRPLPICFVLRTRRCHAQQLADGRGQMTHDMALRPRPLFMASHISEGLVPWGAPQPLPVNLAQPAFSAHLRPGRHKRIHTLSTVRITITIMWQHAHMTEKYSKIKYISSQRSWFSGTTFTDATLFHKRWSGLYEVLLQKN